MPVYAHLVVGGKLVAMLLTSREVQELYTQQYGERVSIIASQMAGRPIIRDTTLCALTTTSLYGVGSSQYNRLKLRASEHRGLGHDLTWNKLGDVTSGFGTVHLSNETVSSLRKVSIAENQFRRVNSVFGEGASPRLRIIREGLDALGLESDHILHHATPRIVFGCELYPGALTDLMRREPLKKPKRPTVAAISRAWRRRWLSQRSKRQETIDKLRALGANSVLASLQTAREMSEETCLPALSS
jgi:hypothetical protein